MENQEKSKKLVSIIAVAFNEEACIEELSRRIIDLINSEMGYRWEIVLVDNGSIDNTWNHILIECKKDRRFKGIRLSRNFQMDGGLLAGLDMISSEACVLMAADLQDPPEVISKFLRKWEEGSENVYAQIVSRKHSSWLRRINSVIFYTLAGFLSGGVIKRNVSDFRLVDKKVYSVVREMQERNRFLRGLFSWVGFDSTSVTLDRPARYGGKSQAHTSKVISLALRGLLAHSYIPLRIISFFGFMMAFLSIAALAVLTLAWIYWGVPFQGFGTLAALILVNFAFISFMIGVIGEYIALIYEESKNRPNFIVREKTW